MASALKAALEDLLRARRLQAEVPPLRGEDRRLSPLATGLAAVDGLLAGGFPRGEVSELHGPASSGRTGIALALVARSSRAGALSAWLDPADRLDPASAASAGVDLTRLLWMRGAPDAPARALTSALQALGALLGSGLFEAVVLDLAGVPATDVRQLPPATWIRAQRMLGETLTALVLLAVTHTAKSPGGVSLALGPAAASWSGRPGPGRLLRGLAGEARAGRPAPRAAGYELWAGH